MFQLIKKDIVTQRYFAYLAPLFLLPYFLTIGKNNENPPFINLLTIGKNTEGPPLILVMIFSMSIAFIAYFMVMYSNFNTNEGEKLLNRLLLSLPVRRIDIIMAKYISVLVWWLVSFVSYLILFYGLGRLFEFGLAGSLDLRIIPLSLCFTYILSSVFYPLHFKFGYRSASVVGILMFFVITSSVGKIFSPQSRLLSVVAEYPIITMIIFSLLVSVVSFYLSLNIFKRKDF